jgi:hypothetical protein
MSLQLNPAFGSAQRPAAEPPSSPSVPERQARQLESPAARLRRDRERALALTAALEAFATELLTGNAANAAAERADLRSFAWAFDALFVGPQQERLDRLLLSWLSGAGSTPASAPLQRHRETGARRERLVGVLRAAASEREWSDERRREVGQAALELSRAQLESLAFVAIEIEPVLSMADDGEGLAELERELAALDRLASDSDVTHAALKVIRRLVRRYGESPGAARADEPGRSVLGG